MDSAMSELSSSLRRRGFQVRVCRDKSEAVRLTKRYGRSIHCVTTGTCEDCSLRIASVHLRPFTGKNRMESMTVILVDGELGL